MNENITWFMEDVHIELKTKLLTWVQLAYGLPSLFLMFFCFLLIATRKKYKNSTFYILVLFDLLTNICVYVNTWIAIRMEWHPSMIFILKGIQITFPGFIDYIKYFSYWFFHMHFWSAALLTIHRLTSLKFPHQYERFWKRYWPLVFLVVCIYSHLPRYLWNGYLYEVYIENGKLICMSFPQTINRAINVVAIFSGIYFIVNLTNGMICAVYAARHIESAPTKSSRINIKKKLTTIALIYSFAYTAEVTWSILNSLNSYHHFMPKWFVENNTMLLTCASDMFTLCLPYVLLMFDTNVRSDLYFCTRKKKSQVGTIIVSVTLGSRNR